METPGPKYGKVEFDGLAEIPWDFKVHPIKDPKGKESTSVILNDSVAIAKAIKQFGRAGLILASGDAEYNDKSRKFQRWHQKLKGGLSNYEEERISRDAHSRLRKTSFALHEISLYLLDVKNAKKLGSFQEGFRNSDGSPRNKKACLKLGNISPIKTIKFKPSVSKKANSDG